MRLRFWRGWGALNVFIKAMRQHSSLPPPPPHHPPSLHPYTSFKILVIKREFVPFSQPNQNRCLVIWEKGFPGLALVQPTSVGSMSECWLHSENETQVPSQKVGHCTNEKVISSLFLEFESRTERRVDIYWTNWSSETSDGLCPAFISVDTRNNFEFETFQSEAQMNVLKSSSKLREVSEEKQHSSMHGIKTFCSKTQKNLIKFWFINICAAVGTSEWGRERDVKEEKVLPVSFL